MNAIRQPLRLFALPATLLWAAPGLRENLDYNRAAIFAGEWWRLWTGHWVHFSPSHLGWNLVVLLAAGTWLEAMTPGALLRYTLTAAPLISLTLLLGEPAMDHYGGLSGLATGSVVLLALAQLGRQQSDFTWWSAILVLIAIKIAYDATHAQPLFSRFAGQAVRASVWAHAAGAASGYFLSRLARIRHPIPRLVCTAPPNQPFR